MACFPAPSLLSPGSSAHQYAPAPSAYFRTDLLLQGQNPYYNGPGVHQASYLHPLTRHSLLFLSVIGLDIDKVFIIPLHPVGRIQQSLDKLLTA